MNDLMNGNFCNYLASSQRTIVVVNQFLYLGFECFFFVYKIIELEISYD